MLTSMAGRPVREAPSPSALPPALLRHLADRKVDATLVAAAGDVTLDAADADEIPITSAGLAAMLDACCDALADPHLALRLPRELAFRRYDALTLAARASSSPRAVFDLFVRYAPLVFPGLAAEVADDAAEVRLAMKIAGQPRGLGLAVDEYLVASALALATRGESMRPVRAWLSSSRPANLEPLFLALGTHELELGARDTGFALGRSDADAPLPGADPMLLATAQHLAGAALAAVPRRGAFAVVVATAIEKRLGASGTPSSDDIAEALHMSTRTLQRRLDDEGTRFSEVLDAVRHRVARDLLLDPSLTLAEVAFRTGFSDLATFSRAFKRWSGLPPGAYRQRAPGAPTKTPR
jgi:AraC-like DNA-binding protein